MRRGEAGLARGPAGAGLAARRGGRTPCTTRSTAPRPRLTRRGSMTGDSWEDHADWWQREFTDGADPEYAEQILPLAEAWLAGFDRVLDIGTGEGQVARGCARPTASPGGRASTRPPAQVRRGPAPRPAVRLRCGPGPSTLPFADASFDAAVACLVFEHIDDLDEALAEVARVLRPGGPLRVVPQPPAAADPGQRVDRRPDPRPARAVLAHRALPERGLDPRTGGGGRVHPLRAPPAQPLPQHHGRPAGLAFERMLEPAPPPGLPGPGPRVRRGGHHPAPGRAGRSPSGDAGRLERPATVVAVSRLSG